MLTFFPDHGKSLIGSYSGLGRNKSSERLIGHSPPKLIANRAPTRIAKSYMPNARRPL
jgi:hypothetical protein